MSPGPGFPIDAGICVDLIKKAEIFRFWGVSWTSGDRRGIFGGKIVHTENNAWQEDVVTVGYWIALYLME